LTRIFSYSLAEKKEAISPRHDRVFHRRTTPCYPKRDPRFLQASRCLFRTIQSSLFFSREKRNIFSPRLILVPGLLSFFHRVFKGMVFLSTSPKISKLLLFWEKFWCSKKEGPSSWWLDESGPFSSSWRRGDRLFEYRGASLRCVVDVFAFSSMLVRFFFLPPERDTFHAPVLPPPFAVPRRRQGG